MGKLTAQAIAERALQIGDAEGIEAVTIRRLAADLGVAVDQVARTVETMLGGRNVTRYKRGSDQYDVIVQTVAAGRATPDDIEKLFVRARNDVMVPLSSLVTVRESVGARELNHFNQRRSVTITAMAAIDMALWDLKGKHHGEPIHRLLGGKFHDRIPAYASILFGQTGDETVKIAERWRDRMMDRGWTRLRTPPLV